MKLRRGLISSVPLFIALAIIVYICLPNSLSVSQAQGNYPGSSWQRTDHPEEIGWSTEKLDIAQKYAQSIGSLGDVIVVDGTVIAEWGNIKKPTTLNSVRKSFLSSLYGIYVDQGKINLLATLEDYDIDDYPPQLTEQEKQARVVDLLEARSGIYHAAAYETKGMKQKRPLRGSRAPGEFWYYNNWDFNALGTIFEKQVGTSIFEAFENNIAKPLEMEDFSLGDQVYQYEPESKHPAYIFKMSTRDMARFGLLYLRNGEWNGKQIIPQRWITESTTSYSDAGHGKGYGYLWWVSVDNRLLGTQLAGPAYYAHGHGGQLIVVVPYLNLVIAHTTDHGNDTAQEFEKLFQLIIDAKIN